MELNTFSDFGPNGVNTFHMILMLKCSLHMDSVDAKFGPDFIKNRSCNDMKYFEKAKVC